MREWTLWDGGSGFQPIGLVQKGPPIDGHVHVVEYSALAKANERIEKLREALKDINKAVHIDDYSHWRAKRGLTEDDMAADDAMKEGGE